VRVPLLDEDPLRRPEFPDIRVDARNQRVDLIVDDAVLVAPESQQTIRLHDSSGFGEKRVDVEPVQCLRNRNEIDRAGIEARVLGTRHPELDVAGTARGCKLLLARICRYDAPEVAGQ